MRSEVMRCAWVLLCGAFMSACASRAPKAAGVSVDSASVVESRFAPSDPVAATILSGFELADDPGDWRIGDRVLMGLSITKPEGVTTRYLLVELTDQRSRETFEVKAKSKQTKTAPARSFEIQSSIVHTRLTLFDEQGARLDEVLGNFPRDLLGSGLYDGASVELSRKSRANEEGMLAPITDEEYDTYMRGWITLFAFSGTMNKNGLLTPLFKDVIARPSVLSFILKPEISLSPRDGGARASEAWVVNDTSREALEYPLACMIAGKRAADADLRVVRSVAPLSLCGGIIHAQGRRGDQRAIRFEIKLLAAARGAGGQRFAGEP